MKFGHFRRNFGQAAERLGEAERRAQLSDTSAEARSGALIDEIADAGAAAAVARHVLEHPEEELGLYTRAGRLLIALGDYCARRLADAAEARSEMIPAANTSGKVAFCILQDVAFSEVDVIAALLAGAARLRAHGGEKQAALAVALLHGTPGCTNQPPTRKGPKRLFMLLMS